MHGKDLAAVSATIDRRATGLMSPDDAVGTMMLSAPCKATGVQNVFHKMYKRGAG